MDVNEIFYSVQGEGISIGTPCVFLRLAHCNLHCQWCDTKYTWNFPKNSDEIKPMDSDAVYKELTSFSCKHLVLTGGEPLLNFREELFMLLSRLKAHGWYIEVETNGTILPPIKFTKYIDQWNVSPKLKNSGNEKSLREIPHALEFYSRSPKSYFKLVIDVQKDIVEVIELAKKHKIAGNKIILMPQSIDANELRMKSRWLIDMCKKYNYRFSPRLHIDIWGNKRKK